MQLHDFTSLCPVGQTELVPLLTAQISVRAPDLYLQSAVCPELKCSDLQLEALPGRARLLPSRPASPCQRSLNKEASK